MRTIVIVAVIVLAAHAGAFGLGRREQIITVYGRIVMIGPAPHRYLAIEAEDGTIYRLTGELVDAEVARYQGATLEIAGVIESDAAGPTPAVLRVTAITQYPEDPPPQRELPGRG